MARDLSRHHQARTEKTTACARIPLRTRNGPSCHCDPPAGVHSKYWKSHTTTIFLLFLMFEVRFLHADPHRFVLLISLFHQMKGMPWMLTPSPLPWAPGSDVTPGRGGGGSPGNLGGGVPPGYPNPDPISDQKMSFSTPLGVFRPDLWTPYLFFRQKLCHHF